MNELLVKRITRRLENLSDTQGYQALDYIEFLERKYGTGMWPRAPVERLADAVEDTLRAARLPGVAIRATVGAVDTAGNVMSRLAQAGKAALDELVEVRVEQREGAKDRDEREGGKPGQSA